MLSASVFVVIYPLLMCRISPLAVRSAHVCVQACEIFHPLWGDVTENKSVSMKTKEIKLSRGTFFYNFILVCVFGQGEGRVFVFC